MFKLAIVLAFTAVACHGQVQLDAAANIGNSVLFYAYSLQNHQSPVTVLPVDDSIDDSPILARRRTIIVVHGHSGSAFTSLNPIVKDAILSAEDLNVVVVDWSLYAGLSYSIASGQVEAVADELVAFIRLLVAKARVTALSELHLVGFDLGAHVVGFTGRKLGGAVGRITGLDPSGNLWSSNSDRLRISDARYVEVIHTDSRGILANGIGTALGNIDFFANGGSSQPGCFTHSCSHERAYELFAASITNTNLQGRPCSSNTLLNLNMCGGLALRMGGTDLSKVGSGIYRVNTGRTFPF